MRGVVSGLLVILLTGGVTSAVPAAPTNLVAQVSGTTVTLSWSAPPGPVLGYQLEAGSGPGLSNLANAPAGSGVLFVAPGVVPGTYYVRVRAIDAGGVGPPSNEVVVVVGSGGGCVVPAAPAGLTATATGSSASISWQPVSGAGITYTLDVGSAPGLANIGTFPVGASTSMTASAPNGTFYLRVRAINACGTSGPPSADTMLIVGGAAPPPAPPAAHWLTQVNDWRARSGLAAVTENPTFSQGDAMHARYTVKHDVVMHDEDPSSPWYTPEGRAAAIASNGAANASVTAPDSYAIESWVQAPFHSIGMFDPRLRTTGYGSYRENDGGLRMSGWLDVIRGAADGPTPALPIIFPADGVTIPIPNAALCPAGTACIWGESPNPAASCPGYSLPAGLPFVLQFTPYTNPVVTGSTLSRNGVPLEHCVFTGGTYANPDAASQQAGRDILHARGGVVVLPRLPLPASSTYMASVTVNGQTRQWSFTIGAAADHGPTPEWALKAVPPSFPRPQ